MQHYLLTLGLCAGMAICGVTAGAAQTPTSDVAVSSTPIQHVVVIMQENRSFDNYFGSYPGADGIPKQTCVPIDPTKATSHCVRPFHDPHDANAGGPHSYDSAQFDLDDGITTTLLDGFVYLQDGAATILCRRHNTVQDCANYADGVTRHDTMGYHTADEIPNYWAYAQHFVLQDHIFEGVRSLSGPSHLDLTSEWVARCTNSNDARTCHTSTSIGPIRGTFPWVSLFQFLDAHRVSWKYYLGAGKEPDCEDDQMTCDPNVQTHGVASLWNPAPYYKWIKQQGKAYLTQHNPDIDQFLIDAESGTLPQVAWIVPSDTYSEHPNNRVTTGMEYVTSLVNAVMSSPAWNSTAIFISWDDWGGFYDHVAPPDVDTNNSPYPIQGFGLRTPGLMISPYARAGLIDHNVLSFDSYATFFEDLFAGGARLDPAALGNPDSRPDQRDNLKTVKFVNGSISKVGNLMDEFDFSQTPLQPLMLSTHIPTNLSALCSADDRVRCTSSTVSLSWNAVADRFVPGPFTYHVTRDGTDLAQCVSTTATSCTDAPGSGNHLYRTYSVDSNGVASPLSAAYEADEP